MNDIRDQIARTCCRYLNNGKLSESKWQQWRLIGSSYKLADAIMPIVEAAKAQAIVAAIEKLDNIFKWVNSMDDEEMTNEDYQTIYGWGGQG